MNGRRAPEYDRMSLRAEIVRGAQALREVGVPSPTVDAEELAAHLLGIARTRLALAPLVDRQWAQEYRAVVARRAERVPLQHITGLAPLAGGTVLVGPGVFIPRPETESLVVWAIEAVRHVRQPVIVDLCSGTGAIALTLARARPDAAVHAVERSAAALTWARRNAERHAQEAGTPIMLRAGDVTEPGLLDDLAGTADLVTVNPPYVPDGTPVEPEVAWHDPAEAVFAGPTGLDVIRPLVAVIARLLKIGGLVALEHDESQAASVPRLFAAESLFTDVRDHPDLAERPRFVTARRTRRP